MIEIVSMNNYVKFGVNWLLWWPLNMVAMLLQQKFYKFLPKFGSKLMLKNSILTMSRPYLQSEFTYTWECPQHFLEFLSMCFEEHIGGFPMGQIIWPKVK